MGLHGAKDIELRFTRYVEELVSVIGHADRAGPFHDYCTGLVMPGERKSVEPMAAITAPGRTAAQHQSLLHFVGQAAWSDDDVLTKVRQMVLPQITRDGPIEAWIIDDTGIPKKGQHSVGVSHQYCGQLGKQANCQVAVTLSLANRHASLPVAYRLYLPRAWAEDDDRRAKVGVPEEITFKTKPQIALEQVRWACEVGLAGSMVLVDAGYGNDSKLRAGITELGKRYVAGIQPQTLVWKPGKRTRTFALRFLQTSPRGDSPCVVTNPSPPSGWVEDFHLQVTEHVQHTTKSLRDSPLKRGHTRGRGNQMRDRR
jgi:SRSO17 transposase